MKRNLALMMLGTMALSAFWSPATRAQGLNGRQAIMLKNAQNFMQRASRIMKPYREDPKLKDVISQWDKIIPCVLIAADREGNMALLSFNLPKGADRKKDAKIIFVNDIRDMPEPSRKHAAQGLADFRNEPETSSKSIYWYNHPVSDEWMLVSLLYLTRISMEQNFDDERWPAILLTATQLQSAALDTITGSKFGTTLRSVKGFPILDPNFDNIDLTAAERDALDDLFKATEIGPVEQRYRYTTYMILANLNRRRSEQRKLEFTAMLVRGGMVRP